MRTHSALAQMRYVAIMESQNQLVNQCESRLDALERRVAELENTVAGQVGAQPTPETAAKESAAAETDRLSGTVSFSGQILSAGGRIDYAWQRPVSYLCEEAWEKSFERISSLAHPVRMNILAELLTSPCSVTQLIERSVVTSTGKAYHHLNELQSGGWVEKDSGGVFRIPIARVVPLVVMTAAAEDH